MRLFTNNAIGQLASGITDVATSMTLSSSQGALFPAISGAPDHFMVTLVDSSNNIEIVKVTARSSDVLTIVRGQEGTSGTAYLAGDRVELRNTAGQLENSMLPGLVQNSALAAGTVDVLTASFPGSSDISFDDMMMFLVESAGANTVTTPTLNITLGSTAVGAKTIVKGVNAALEVGDIGAAGYPMLLQYNAGLDKFTLMNPAYGFKAFAPGTRMMFQQTAAPTGWTKDTASNYNDAGLSLTTGTVGVGGTVVFSNAFGSSSVTEAHTLTTAQLAVHAHGGRRYTTNNAPSTYGTQNFNNVPIVNISGPTGQNAGSGSSHDHGMPELKYADAIVASQD
jgi:hypothetical protein